MVASSQAVAAGAGRRRPVWSKWPLAAALVVWCGFVGLATLPEFHAGARSRVPWMLSPLFHDWQVVRQGWEAWQRGVDPLAAAAEPFNYPRCVLLGAQLGAGRVPLEVAGVMMAGMVLAALVFLLRPEKRWQALMAVALVGSPPILLLLERANLDAWALVLVIAGVAWFGRPNGGWAARVGGSGLVLAAALVKLFPVVAFAGLAWFGRGRGRLAAVAGLALFALWLATGTGEIALILRKTTRGLEPAYGRMTAGSRYYVERVAPTVGRPEAEQWLREAMNASLVDCVAAFAVAAVIGWKGRRRAALVPSRGPAAAWFVGGALIYGGTFLLGSNWSYRLVFLLLCVPWLWRAWEVPGMRAWAGGGLGAVGVVLWAPFHLEFGWAMAREAVTWLLAAGLTGGAVAVLAGAADPETPPPAGEDPICAPGKPS